MMAGVYSAVLNPALGVMAMDLNRSINGMAVLSGYMCGFIAAACSRK